jgi:hypothetical protein
MTPSSSVRCRIKNISARTSPDKVLDDLQKASQDYRAYASADANAQNSHPKTGRSGL